MPRANTLQPSFNAGELSPRMAARVDFRQYDNAAEVMENLVPLPQGGATRRPGTRYVADVADHAVKPRLIPFVFSTVQAYMLELGAGAIRAYRDQGQITVAPTDAAITNGGFDSGIANWDDRSTGSGSIGSSVVTDDQGTFGISTNGDESFGDAAGTDQKNCALRFDAVTTGTVVSVKIKTGSSHTANGGCTAQIWTLAGPGSSPTEITGSPSDPVTINASASEFTFTWSAGNPVLTSGTRYYVVIANDQDTTLSTTLETVAGQAGNISGREDDITDIAHGSGGFPVSDDWRIKVDVRSASGAEGRLVLQGAAASISWAEQDVTTTDIDQEHVLRFRAIGTQNDTIQLRIGNTSTGSEHVNDLTLGVGYHAIAFTPNASPFYVQFRNPRAKDVAIDDVSLIAGAPVEVGSPYAEADLPTLKWAQTADVLYLTAGGPTPVYKLERRGHTSWSLVEADFIDGPYLDENDTGTTLTPGAATGLGQTLVASADLFAATDVGRLVRYKSATAFGYAIITAVTDPQNVTIDVIEDFDGTGAKTTWRLGAWSATSGYPSTVSFFEQRSAFAGTTSQPQTFWLSQSADIENMKPDDNEGTVEADDAIDFTFAADQVNAVRWMSPGPDLVVGTVGGEWVISSNGPVITPTDIQARRHTTMGSANVQPVRARARLLLVQRALRKLLEFVFNFQVDGFEALDLTLLADHVTHSGIADLAYQQEPDSTLWAVRADGVLATLAYQPDQQVVGWSRQLLGGRFIGGPAVVDSLTVIPGTERDEVWLAVKRTIGGAAKRFVEVMESPLTGAAGQVDAFYVDSGLSLDRRNTDVAKALTLTAALADDWSAGASGTLSATGHAPFLAGDVGELWGLWRDGAVAWVRITGVASDTEAAVAFVLAVPDSLRARATVSWLDPDDKVSVISGLDHLDGETVAVLADGAVQPERIVASGSITLAEPAGIVQAGLPYAWTFRSLKLAFGAAGGASVAKPKRVHAASLVLLDSLGVSIGPDAARLTALDFREVSHPMDIAVPLFTGERRVALDGDWARDPRLTLSGSDPVPVTLLAIAPELLTNEMI